MPDSRTDGGDGEGAEDEATGSLDRRRVEAVLDGVVRRNRFTIAVVFPVVGAVLLVASAESLLPAPLAFNPLLVLVGIAVMRLPLIAGLAPLVDRRAAVVLLGLTAYVYAIEAVGVATGLPYGEFSYLVTLGPMVAGIPVALPLFFVPLAADGFLLARAVLPAAADRRLVALPLAVGVVLAVDLVLDPGAVALGFWAYADGGAYYGVPLTNYAGWLLSGSVAVLALAAAFDRDAIADRLRDCEYLLDDFVSFTLLWGAVNLVYANWVPVVVAVSLLLALVTHGRFSVPQPRWWGRLAGDAVDAD